MPRLSHQEQGFKLQKVSDLASSFVVLLSGLPPSLRYKWLSCAEMDHLFQDVGNTFLGIDSIRASCVHATKLGHLECRKFLKTCVRFYRLQRMESSSRTLQEERGANWVLQPLPSSYFTTEILLNHVRAVNDFVSYNEEIIATNKRKACEEAIIPRDESSTPTKRQNVEVHHQTPTSVTRPASLVEITCPPVAQITPEKDALSFQACRGWTGDQYEPLFRQSLTEFSYSVAMDAQPTHVFGIASVYINIKGASELAFCYEPEKGFKLRSKACTGRAADTTNRRFSLCGSCSLLVKAVSATANSASRPVKISPEMPATKANFTKLSPDGCVAFVKQVRKKKDQELQNVRRRESRLKKLMERGTSPIDDDHTLSSVQQILEAVAPYIDKTFGKDSERAIIWREALRQLVKPEGEGPMYHDIVLKYALSKLPKFSKATYESVQKLLFLPSRRHAQRISQKLVSGDEGLEDGPRNTACKTMKRVAKENGWTDDALDMVVTFDGMIMRGCLLLSGKKETKNKLVGCHLRESDSVIEKCFDDYVRKISAASLEQDTFESTLGEALTTNKEHLVYYAKSLKPGVDLCFIIAAYNLPSTQAHHISGHVYECILLLEENNFNVRILCADNAQCNESYFHSKCTMKASKFIPPEVLQKHGLSGDFTLAFENPVNREPIFIISDPPHALKKVGSSLEHRGLHWDGCEMTMKMLFDVHEAINTHQGEGCLSANPKFAISDFFGNRFLAMGVKRSAKIFSGTMDGMVAQVCEEPENYPLATCPTGTDRTQMFSKIRELIQKIDRFFDICNGKDPKNPFAKASPKTGPGYADELLEVLAWFTQWDDWLRQQPGKYQPGRFITRETFRSLKYICYGFASLIYELCVRKGRTISLSRVNQDVNEKHFGNVRERAGSHQGPNQGESMACIPLSTIMRLHTVERGNCPDAPDQRTTIPITKPKKKVCLKLLRRNGDRKPLI